MPLFVVATPIGNLGDLSARARTVLVESDVVLCEDTRHTRKLFAALDMPTPEMWSCHAHNEDERIPRILERLEQGQTLSLVSDAGTPAISDPGGRIVSAAHRSGHSVFAVAGPSSISAALSVSGFAASPFFFLGFPPRKLGALRETIKRALMLGCCVVILESGKRVERLLRVLQDFPLDREVVICRELTKLHEEIRRVRISEIEPAPLRGEVVLVIGPGTPFVEEKRIEIGEDAGLKSIANVLASRWGCSKRDAYRRLLEWESDD